MSAAVANLLLEAPEGAALALPGSPDPAYRLPDLARQAACIRELLLARGMEGGEPVHVIVRNHPSDIATMLGVWRAGGAVVPVHRSALAATRQAVARTSGARFELHGNGLDMMAAAPPRRRQILDGAALVIFTSGTTGQPKGAVIGHDRFAGKLNVLQQRLAIRSDDIVIVPLQLTFIFGLWVSLLSLRAGAKVVLVPRFSANALRVGLADGATVAAVVPTMLRTLFTGVVPDAPMLRTILTGGEPLGAALARRTMESFPGAGIFDLYGLTETGACDFCLAPSDYPDGAGAIGHPTAGVSFRIVGENGTVLGCGEAGELRIRTPFRMLGYLDQPELTAASFDAEGYFRTGDLGRLRGDGRVELVGRSKDIISRGGNKIAPLEIDNLLCAHPGVAAALCAGVPDERLGEAIHAVVVVKPGAKLTVSELIAWTSARTERFKVPDMIHIADALPVGGSGKASRAQVVEFSLRPHPTPPGPAPGEG